MSGKTPRISVGMPVYNGEPYLEDAIACILNQTDEDFELIISDNASSDRTEEICRDTAIKDPRVIYSRNSQNIGAAGNYNRVFKLASGPYFRWFNADDLCAPDLHEKCLAALEEDPGAVLSYGKTTLIDQDGATTGQYEDHLDLRQERAEQRFLKFFESVGLTNAIYGLMRTAAVAKTALMGDGRFPAADINFMAELTLHGRFIELPAPLFFRRMHQGAYSANANDESKETQFWTGGAKKYTMPVWKQNFAHITAIRTSPLPRGEKLRLLKYVLRRMNWQRRALLQDVCNEFRSRFAKSPQAEKN